MTVPARFSAVAITSYGTQPVVVMNQSALQDACGGCIVVSSVTARQMGRLQQEARTAQMRIA